MRSLRTFPQFPELGRSGWFQMWCSDAPGDSPALSPVFLVVMEQSSWIFIWFMYNPHPKLTVLGLLSSILGPMIWITEEACGLIQVGGAGTCYWIFNRLCLPSNLPVVLLICFSFYANVQWWMIFISSTNSTRGCDSGPAEQRYFPPHHHLMFPSVWCVIMRIGADDNFTKLKLPYTRVCIVNRPRC